MIAGEKLTALPSLSGFLAVGYLAVSYTHLRAHETDSYLVCRLLLEKKQNNTPQTPAFLTSAAH